MEWWNEGIPNAVLIFCCPCQILSQAIKQWNNGAKRQLEYWNDQMIKWLNDPSDGAIKQQSNEMMKPNECWNVGSFGNDSMIAWSKDWMIEWSNALMVEWWNDHMTDCWTDQRIEWSCYQAGREKKKDSQKARKQGSKNALMMECWNDGIPKAVLIVCCPFQILSQAIKQPHDLRIEWWNDLMIEWLNDWMMKWLNDHIQLDWSNDRMIPLSSQKTRKHGNKKAWNQESKKERKKEWSNDGMMEWWNDGIPNEVVIFCCPCQILSQAIKQWHNEAKQMSYCWNVGTIQWLNDWMIE